MPNTMTYQYTCNGFLVRHTQTGASIFFHEHEDFVGLAETFGWEGLTACDTDHQAAYQAYQWLRGHCGAGGHSSLTAIDEGLFDQF